MEIRTQKEALNAELFRAPEISGVYAELLENTLVGSMKSMKYHNGDCVYGQSISERNRIVFENAGAAREAGFTACGVCLP